MEDFITRKCFNCAMKDNRYLDGTATIDLEVDDWYYGLKLDIVVFFKLDIEPKELTILSMSVLKKVEVY